MDARGPVLQDRSCTVLLERVALHQTRLKLPGLGLDPRGVAIGARGLSLFASLDRFAAFLATYSRGQGLESIAAACRIEVVRSNLGLRELVFSFDAESTERLDRLAETARLVGGLTFTGSSRHYVQYRDGDAPFGYDVSELLADEARYVLYHSSFSQSYELERTLDLRRMLLWLEPRSDARSGAPSAPLWLLVEPGLGQPLTAHFASAGLAAGAGTLQDGRWLFRLDELPDRVRPLLRGVPGIAAFRPVGPGVAVELGFEHPVALEACPVFDAAGLVLFRGRREPPLALERAPLLASVADLVRVSAGERAPELLEPAPPRELRVEVQVVPGAGVAGAISAACIAPDEFELLRRIAYHLPVRSLESLEIAITEHGAFVLDPGGLEALPLGARYREIHPNLLLPVGHTLRPAIAPARLFEALGSPPGTVLFLRPGAPPIGIERAHFVALERALGHAERWVSPGVVPLPPLTGELGTVWLEPLGRSPLRNTS